jgi:hypothetical protein
VKAVRDSPNEVVGMWTELPPIWLEVEIFLFVSSGSLLVALLVGWWLKADFMQSSRWTSTLGD